MKITVPALCLLILSAAAAEEQMEFMGFSADGEHFACAIFGIYEGSAFPYGKVYVYDSVSGIVSDSMASTDQTGEMDPDSVIGKILADNADFLLRYDIQEENVGLPLEFPVLDSPPGASMLHFSFHEPCEGLPQGLYSLDLFQNITDSATVFFGIHPSTCRLQLTRASNSCSMELLDWDSSPLMDETVYNFGLEGLRLHPSGVMVIFLSCTIQGFEIPETITVPLIVNDFTGLEQL